MSQQIKKKFIEANAIDGSKLQFSNDEAFRIKKLDGSDQDVFKLDISDKLQFLVSPYVGPNSTDQLAPKSYVDQKVADLVASAPSVLDTLNELSAAIANDPNFATSVASQVAGVQTNLDSEISRATGVEGSLQSQIDALESLSGSGLTQEISDRIAGDAAEAAARAAEDLTFVKLDGTRPMTGNLNLGQKIISNTKEVQVFDSGNMNQFSLAKPTELSTTDLAAGQFSRIESGQVIQSAAGKAGVLNSLALSFTNEGGISASAGDLTLFGSSGIKALVDVSVENNKLLNVQSVERATGDISITASAGNIKLGSSTQSESPIYVADSVASPNLSSNLQASMLDLVDLGNNYETNLGPNSITMMDSTLGSESSLSLDSSGIYSDVSAVMQVFTGDITLQASGQVKVAAELSMETHKIVGLVDGSVATDAATYGQVSAVSSSLATEIADRIADVNAEESRAMAAESALDGRLDILEGDATVVGSVAKAEADAKAYTDSEIAALVNGAPALLDTLNELAAAINDDANFAVTVANSIAGVQSNLTQEISDRIADVNAEESRAMGVEASLQSQITQEISDRQADVNAEESRAMGVEASLQSQITQEISDRQADVTAEETRAMAAESALDARVVALEGVAVQFASEKFTLSAGDISNGYVTLGHVAVAGSMNAFVDRLAIFETDDYTLSTVSGVTRVTFVGSLVTAGQEKLSSGDVVRVKYAYEVL